MKQVLVLFAAVLLVVVRGMAGSSPIFFAFDNGVGRDLKWAPEQQAAVLSELGYDGIGYSGTADLAARQQAFRAAGLKIISLYVPCYVDRAASFDAGLKEVMPQLKDSGTILWLTVQGKATNDAVAVRVVREIADAAADFGLRVVLYPHKGFFVATAEDAVRIVEQAGSTNLGVTINLAHELAAGNTARMGEVIRRCGPLLSMVSINGANHSGGWRDLIKPLDEGTFDVSAFLQQLRDARYAGPVGLQCYQISGDVKEQLGRSIRAWHKFNGDSIATP